MLGQTVSHYRVLHPLGAGGMGEVYLAEDTHLGRKVALKVLPPDLTRDECAKARFIREARSASSLDHPNVCTVYDIEEMPDGRLVLAMAYCEGESLKAHLARGPLPIAEALDLAAQVADGLAEAHARGVVHRDIKPANVMVTKTGRVKIVDFGLARLSGTVGVTTTGTMLGTPAYMAPEQARGEEVDGRADLWALGVVLYEMLTGRPPFSGDSMEAVLYGILNRAPEPIDRLHPTLPPALVRVVNRALAKDPRGRYQQAEQFLADLRACRESLPAKPQAREAEPRVPSIAVLPFFNMSPDPDQEYFCEGLSEELIGALGRLGGVRVASFTSALQFRGQAADIRRIGEQLNVDTVLEGSVRKAGDRLRVTAQLVNVGDGYHLWSERYDRRLDDVFAVQEDIARAIVEQLKVNLIGGSDRRLVSRVTADMDAYQLYLRARYHYGRRYAGALEQALKCFEQAAAKDPACAAAHAGIAGCLTQVGFWGLVPPERIADRARSAAARAVALDERLPDAQWGLGLTSAYFDWDPVRTERAFRRAIELNPNVADSCVYLGVCLPPTGRFDEAAVLLDQAISLDPVSALVAFLAGASFLMMRDYTRALAELERALEMDPGFAPAHSLRGFALSVLGRCQEAVASAERGAELWARAPILTGALGYVLASAGRRDETRALCEDLRRRAASEFVSPVAVSMTYCGLGEEEEALDAIEEGIGQRWVGCPVYLSLAVYDVVRHHPRFVQLVEGIGWPSLAHLAGTAIKP